jgi:nucleotide sugar dehydrogenase
VKKIGVIGIGKLGLCLALELERIGFDVTGVDLNPNYIDQLNDRSLISPEPGVSEYLQHAKHFTATIGVRDVLDDAFPMLFVLVPTPNLPEGGYDHAHIEALFNELVAFGRRNIPVRLVIGCTTLPGYCNGLAERLAPYNYLVSYKPEFIAQGNILHDMEYPDIVLIGENDEASGDEIQAIFEQLCKSRPAVHRMDRLSAEICKLATNCFLTTKISFANSIGDLAVRSGANPDKILAAIGGDSRIGSKYLRYGFGFGGPCFPRDNRALNYFARNQSFDLLLSQATDTINNTHLDFQFEHWIQRYNPEETIEFDSVAFKKGAVSVEESQQLALALKLASAGRRVLVRDRIEVIDALRQQYGALFVYEIASDAE